MFDNIPWNVWRHSVECLTIFLGMLEEIPRNVCVHSPHSPQSPHSVPRSCIPGFIDSRLGNLLFRHKTCFSGKMLVLRILLKRYSQRSRII